MPLLALLLFLSGCQDHSPSNDLVMAAENNRIQVSFDRLEEAEWEGNKGFYIYVTASSLLDTYKAEDDFLFALNSTITDDNSEVYQALFSETIANDENSVTIKQFYSPFPGHSLDSLDITVYAKPTYYKRKVIFQDLEKEMSNQIMNDLFLETVSVQGNEIQLQIFDIHDLHGLTVSLLQDNEEIYPAFSRTSYDPNQNFLTASYEFTNKVPDRFTLVFKRLKLQEQIWEFPLTIPIKQN